MPKGVRDPVTHRTPEQQKAHSRTYKARPEQVKRRVMRNQARQEAIREGKARVGDGTSVDHIKPLDKGGSNAKSNRRIISVSANSRKGAK